MTPRVLDFLVIGAQKGGTTSLWQYLRRHPGLRMPESKEAPFFTAPDSTPVDFESYMRLLFADAPGDALLGTVTPDYMVGQADVPVEVVVERITATLPDVKLIALLRDPIERAISSYTMAVRRGQEKRPIDAALGDLLDPEELAGGRRHPTPVNTYVAAGEYGRILGAYRAIYPAERLLVAFTEDLAGDPSRVLDVVLAFLGLPDGFRPEGLGMRHFQGGTRKLLDPESERLLTEFHRKEILPKMIGSPTLNKRAFEFFLETWNVAADEMPPSISADLRVRLERHFRSDAESLGRLKVGAPWIARWESQGVLR